MLLSKATYKWGHYRSNQNQQKSNNMQVLLQALVSLTNTLEGFFFFFENKYIEYRKNKPSVSFTRKASS